MESDKARCLTSAWSRRGRTLPKIIMIRLRDTFLKIEVFLSSLNCYNDLEK